MLYTSAEISQLISDANNALYGLATRAESKQLFDREQTMYDQLRITYLLKRAVESGYADGLNDEGFMALCAYLRHKITGFALPVTQAVLMIVDQPDDVSVASGASAGFSVVAIGAGPLTYQWRKNGTNISGATSSTYTIGTTSTGDAGNYTVVVMDVFGNTVVSDVAVLAVAAPSASFTIGWSATDPYVDDLTPPVITNSQSISFTPGSNIIFTGDLTAFADKYVMWSIPATEPTPTSYSNGDPSTALNQGVIPGFEIRDVFTIGALKYIVCRNPLVLDISEDLRLIH